MAAVAMHMGLAWPGPAASDEAPASGAAEQRDIKTRNALFKASSLAELPGWGQDDLATALDAFQASCRVLGRRESWQSVCGKAAALERQPASVRRFFEREFALFRILNVDASPDGKVTGYYEPLINGSLRPEGAFNVPVYGRPNNLYTLDWKTIPDALRRGKVQVLKSGRTLTVLAEKTPDSYELDTSEFDFDSRDRVWRVLLLERRAVPYLSRAEIEAAGRLDAPVVAYVDDPLALYAMQVQGSGRIKLRDGQVLRLQYAEQNGHPFRPLRVVARSTTRVATRGLTQASDEAEGSFELLDTNDSAPAAGEVAPGVLTRGLNRSAVRPLAQTQVADSAVDALVDQLLLGATSKPASRPPASPVVRPSTATVAPTTSVAVRPTSEPAAPGPSVAAYASSAAPSQPGARQSGAVTDPSYVFFRAAPDQSPEHGPIGALGVPLTPGRSIAVDPRVTPLGYPVYMAASDALGPGMPLRRVVLAQDTGGAIRGAIRADFFWGSDAEAGRRAMQTRQAGQMWLMLPHEEADRMRSRAALTRGVGGRSTGGALGAECLVADETFCSEAD